MNDDVIMIVSSWDQMEEDLKRVPHRKLMDLTLCYYVMQRKGKYGSHVDLLLIDYDEAERRGLSDSDALFRTAAKNTMREFPLLIRDLGDDIFVLTNQKNIFGATALFYPGSLVEAAEAVGGDMVIVPFNIHEVVCMPADKADVDEIQNSLIKLDLEQTPGEAVLSTSIYYYNEASQKISALTAEDGLVQ